MSEESEQFKKRIRELADKSYSSSQYFFTDFLTEAEISDALSLGKNAFASGITIYGGYESAERRMLRFGSLEEFGYEEPFPIKVIKIAPLLEKFSDEFTHRDFLGAILNLGIDRKVTGDILIKGKTAYLFCEEKMAEYIADNLYQVKHTHIKCDIIDEIPEGICQHKPFYLAQCVLEAEEAAAGRGHKNGGQHHPAEQHRILRHITQPYVQYPVHLHKEGQHHYQRE